MKKINASKAFFILVLLVSVISCSTTRFVMDSNLPVEPKKALLTGLTIGMNTSSNKETSLLDTVSTIFDSLDLADFGMEAEKALGEYLDINGFNLYTDPIIAKQNDVLLNVGSKISALGYWVHPDTSAYGPVYFTGFIIGFDKRKHMKKVKGDSDVEYFVYADIRIRKAETFLFFGGYPKICVDVVIVNSSGDVVLEARAYGTGKKQFIGANMSEENLSVAFDSAFTNLQALE